MNSIPVFHAIQMQPYLDYCSRAGLAATPSLRKFKLPDALRDAESMYLPQFAAYSAVDDIGQREGVPDIAVRALGRAVLDDFGSVISAAVTFAPTLYTAIQRLQHAAKTEDPSIQIAVRLDRSTAYLSARGNHPEFQCSAWSALMVLVSTIKVFAGTEWQPRHIALACPRVPGLECQSIFPEAKFFWGAGQVSVAFPAALLGSPAVTDNEREVDSASPLALQIALKGLIGAYLPAGSPKIELVAEMTEIPARTLQRHLAQLGLSYSELVEQVRFEKASKLLRESDLKTLDIAFEAGYTDPSNFSRSFRRIASMSPRQYRRQNQAA